MVNRAIRRAQAARRRIRGVASRRVSEYTLEDVVRRFPSKVDWWLAAILIVCPFTAFLDDVITWWEQGRVSPDFSAHVLVFLATAVLITLLTVPVDYSFKTDEVLIRCGRIKKRIRYADIRRMTRAQSFSSAPALSLRRLELTLADGRSVRISPKDMDGFLKELKRRAPHVECSHAGIPVCD